MVLAPPRAQSFISKIIPTAKISMMITRLVPTCTSLQCRWHQSKAVQGNRRPHEPKTSRASPPKPCLGAFRQISEFRNDPDTHRDALTTTCVLSSMTHRAVRMFPCNAVQVLSATATEQCRFAHFARPSAAPAPAHAAHRVQASSLRLHTGGGGGGGGGGVSACAVG